MAFRKFSIRKPSFRDHIAKVNAANGAMEAMYGDVRRARGLPDPAPIILGPKRAYTPRHDKGAKEKSVKQKIREALRADPRVAFVWNEISGQYGDLRVGFNGKPDLLGMLKGGQFFAIETKREKGGIVSEAQESCLQHIRDNGGKAGVARSVEEALAIIEQ